MKKSCQPQLYSNCIVFFALALICGLVYSNTFDASWHLDDQPNIINNTYLHIDSLAPQQLINTFFTDHHNPETLSDKPYRPVACLTFALNWYFGKDSVFGYHVVNLTIHILAAFLLFLFIKMLFRTPRLNAELPNKATIRIAALASLLWAVHPIQTQAVTYIVQRMALLAAFFYILGLYSYMQARLAHRGAKLVLWLIASVVCYLLGIFSKPNAAMLPMAIVLLEIVFFLDLSDKRTRSFLFLSVSVVTLSIVLLGSALFLKGGLQSIISLYDARTFTLFERLMTQPRVLLFYLSQIVFPLPGRLSIAHDIVVSSSLIQPWTTLPSIFCIVFLIGLCISQFKKHPLLSFAFLFFFLNHVIESSLIGLELIFEHRNYLPSFFLFLPLAYGVHHFALQRRSKSTSTRAAIVFATVSVFVFFSMSTYSRNYVWKDDIRLWMDAASKAPNNARASSILAIKLAWGENSRHPKRYDMALKLFEESLKKDLPRNDVKAGIYGNMALIYFHEKKNPQKAFQYFKTALKIEPENLKVRRELAEALTIHRDFEAALEQANILLSKSDQNGKYHNLKGHILLWQGRYAEALDSFNKAYSLLWKKESVLLNSGVALSLAGYHSKAERVLQEAIRRFPADMSLHFAIIENYMRGKAVDHAHAYAEKVLSLFTMREIEQGIERLTDNAKYAPLDAGIIRKTFEGLQKKSKMAE